METLQKIALSLNIVGGLNWALVGLFDFNLVTALFGADSIIANVIYVLIGICAAFNIGILFMHLNTEQ